MVESELAGELGDFVALVGCEERDSDAVPAGAAGAADAVYVGLAVLGRIEVDHVRDPVYVYPTRRDICGDQGVDLA